MAEEQIISRKSKFADWLQFEASNPAKKTELDLVIEKSKAEARDIKKYFSNLPALKKVKKPHKGAILDSFNSYYALQSSAINAAANQFIGFAALSFLAQDPLLNRGVSTLSDEMTREWGELTCKDDITTSVDESKSPTIKVINEAINDLGVKSIFRMAARMTGFYGGCLAYLDLRGPSGEPPDEEELQKPIYFPGRDGFNRGKLNGLTLHGLRLIEPINITPGEFNSIDPLAPDFYEPEFFYVLGKRVHRSRFLYFADNIPAQILKPCYLFFGVSMSQMAYVYVNEFYKLRDAVTKMVTKYSLTYLATPIDALIEQNGPGAVEDRVATIAKYRDNDSMVIIDSISERLEQINTPLGGAKDIWYASLELLPAIFGIPATKLLEISPSGFNATGEFEMRNFYDAVAVKQSNVFDDPMKKLIKILCYVNGVEDPGLVWSWNSLYKLSEKEQAEVNRIKAETSSFYYAMGAVDNQDIAETLKTDERSGFDNIELPEDAAAEDPEGVPDRNEEAEGHSTGETEAAGPAMNRGGKDAVG